MVLEILEPRLHERHLILRRVDYFMDQACQCGLATASLSRKQQAVMRTAAKGLNQPDGKQKQVIATQIDQRRKQINNTLVTGFRQHLFLAWSRCQKLVLWFGLNLPGTILNWYYLVLLVSEVILYTISHISCDSGTGQHLLKLLKEVGFILDVLNDLANGYSLSLLAYCPIPYSQARLKLFTLYRVKFQAAFFLRVLSVHRVSVISISIKIDWF